MLREQDLLLKHWRLSKKLVFILLVCAIAESSAVSAALAQRTRGSKPSAAVDALFAQWSVGRTPGAAVMVIQGGRVVHRKGYGYADLEAGTRIGPDTNFRLASLSKQFTAMAIMVLAEKGNLHYDDPLSKFFREFPPYAHRITVRQLLHHTAGLPDHESLFKRGRIGLDWPRSAKTLPDPYEPTSHDALKLLAAQTQLDFSPGTEFKYSNAGYVVLGQIVEKTSGVPYAQFLKERIFDPMGMRHTVVSDGRWPPVSNLATSYEWKNESYHDIDYTPLNRIVGDDGVFSSLDDLEKWVHALKGKELVKPATLKLAFTPGRLKSGQPIEYGFGWGIGEDEKRELKTVWHSGVWVGFRTCILSYPQRNLTIVVLANSAELNAEKLANEVADIYLGPRP